VKTANCEYGHRVLILSSVINLFEESNIICEDADILFQSERCSVQVDLFSLVKSVNTPRYLSQDDTWYVTPGPGTMKVPTSLLLFKKRLWVLLSHSHISGITDYVELPSSYHIVAPALVPNRQPR